MAISIAYVYKLANSAWDKITEYASDLRNLEKTYDKYISDIKADLADLKNSIGNIDDIIKDRVNDVLEGLSVESLDNAFEHVYNYMFEKIADINDNIDSKYFKLGSEIADLKKSIPELPNIDEIVENRLAGIDEKIYDYVTNRIFDILDDLLDREVK